MSMSALTSDQMALPNCAGCGDPISAATQTVVAAKRKFHHSCFVCAACLKPLADTVHMEAEDGRLLCELDYYQELGETCARCATIIAEQCVHAMDRSWHKHCFTCQKCATPLNKGSFRTKDEHPYCLPCFHEVSGKSGLPVCGRCKQPIEAIELVTLGGQSQHANHHKCATCNDPIDARAYREHEGKLYCLTDYRLASSAKCTACRLPITGKNVTYKGRQYHPEHLVCATCEVKLGGELRCFEYHGTMYCEAHFNEAQGTNCGMCFGYVKTGNIDALNQKWCPEHFACIACGMLLSTDGCKFLEWDGKPMCSPCYNHLPASLKRRYMEYLDIDKKWAMDQAENGGDPFNNAMRSSASIAKPWESSNSIQSRRNLADVKAGTSRTDLLSTRTTELSTVAGMSLSDQTTRGYERPAPYLSSSIMSKRTADDRTKTTVQEHQTRYGSAGGLAGPALSASNTERTVAKPDGAFSPAVALRAAPTAASALRVPPPAVTALRATPTATSALRLPPPAATALRATPTAASASRTPPPAATALRAIPTAASVSRAPPPLPQNMSTGTPTVVPLRLTEQPTESTVAVPQRRMMEPHQLGDQEYEQELDTYYETIPAQTIVMEVMPSPPPPLIDRHGVDHSAGNLHKSFAMAAYADASPEGTALARMPSYAQSYAEGSLDPEATEIMSVPLPMPPLVQQSNTARKPPVFHQRQ